MTNGRQCPAKFSFFQNIFKKVEITVERKRRILGNGGWHRMVAHCLCCPPFLWPNFLDLTFSPNFPPWFVLQNVRQFVIFAGSLNPFGCPRQYGCNYVGKSKNPQQQMGRAKGGFWDFRVRHPKIELDNGPLRTFRVLTLFPPHAPRC